MADPASTDTLPPPPSDTADSSSQGYPGPPSRLPSGDDIEEGNFNDEPKNKFEAIVGEAAFVKDDGEGNTSIMKPRKPAFHHRAINEDEFNRGAKDAKDDDDDDDSTVVEYRNSKWYILSNSIFVLSSTLYVAMACMLMDYYYYYKEVPRAVMNADDDAAWWNYFMNCTDDQFMPENVTNADDDNTWMVWYNETAFFEDDSYYWLPKIANENAEGYEPYVSKYMILYFFAALGFIVTGVIEVILARKHFWYRMLYYGMIIAASFGFVSAILTNKDPLWSNICSAISVHIWALEAILIFVQRCRGEYSDTENYDKQEGFLGLSIRTWFYIADVSFLIGTVGDVGTSYFYIFEYSGIYIGICGIIFAMGWLICALIYLAISIYDHIQFKKYFYELQEHEDGTNGKPLLATGIPMTIGTGLDDYDNTKNNNKDKRSTLTTLASDEITNGISSPPESSNNSSENGQQPTEDNGVNEEKKDDDGDTNGENNSKIKIDTFPDNINIATATTDDVADESCCAVPITNGVTAADTGTDNNNNDDTGTGTYTTNLKEKKGN